MVSALERKLHVAGAAGLLAGGGNLLGQVGGGVDVLRVLHVEVGEEDDLEPVAHGWIGVHRLGNGVDQLDDQLGQEITRRGLGAEDEGARRHVGLRIALQAQVKREDVQHVQGLPLVFMQALGLDIEERFGVHVHAGALFDERREVALGVGFQKVFEKGLFEVRHA
jgi:hypothetical protein